MNSRTAILATRTAAPRKAGILSRLLTALSIMNERRRLAELDTHALRDLGLSRKEVEKEAQRKIWDAPNRWLR